MIIDNFEKIKSILRFKENTYYVVQIIKRRKDKGNESISRSEIKLSEYYIKSLRDLENYSELIKLICDNTNSRAYISLIPRSSKKLAISIIEWLTKKISISDYTTVTRAVSRNSLLNSVVDNRRLFSKSMWIIDLDDGELLETLKSLIMKFTKINFILTTPNGYHLVIDSFNPNLIKDYRKGNDDNYEIEKVKFTLRKECNTILYFNQLKN